MKSITTTALVVVLVVAAHASAGCPGKCAPWGTGYGSCEFPNTLWDGYCEGGGCGTNDCGPGCKFRPFANRLGKGCATGCDTGCCGGGGWYGWHPAGCDCGLSGCRKFGLGAACGTDACGVDPGCGCATGCGPCGLFGPCARYRAPGMLGGMFERCRGGISYQSWTGGRLDRCGLTATSGLPAGGCASCNGGMTGPVDGYTPTPAAETYYGAPQSGSTMQNYPPVDEGPFYGPSSETSNGGVEEDLPPAVDTGDDA